MASNEEILATLRDFRKEVLDRFDGLNGRIRQNEARLAEHSVRIGGVEARSKALPPPSSPPPDFLTIFKAVAPWVLRLFIAGAVVAWGVNAPAIVEALAKAIGG